MNKENLQLMANEARNIPQEKFDMLRFRYGSEKTHECNSVGCLIGHCTKLVPYKSLPKHLNGHINFSEWSEQFTKITGADWWWCFGSHWTKTDNTPIGAALRIEWLIKHGLPKNWADQMNGKAPLCYNI